QDPDRVQAFIEYTHALVLDLAERYEDGEPAQCTLRRELLDENKWRAIRHGHDAAFIRRDGSGVVTLSEVVERETDRLSVSGIRDILEGGSGATRQRRIRDQDGADALCRSLLLEPNETA
ncbi:MAG: carboxylate--amine ligase, partial [Halobacteriales archaeon]|nr:carboxylate--amine ligase [Halobacteriales archaeon]